MARHGNSSLYGQWIAGFDEFIQKKSHITLRSCLLALCFDPTMLIEIAVYENYDQIFTPCFFEHIT